MNDLNCIGGHVRSIIDIDELSVEEIDELISLGKDIMLNPKKYADKCKGKKLATLFFEPSTRTRMSFETAMYELGGNVLSMASAQSSSASKGESIADTAKVTTQTLADLLTINKEKGHFENLTIGFCGDLKFGRPVHSLISAMSRYDNVKFVLISPDELKVPRYVITEIEKYGLEYIETTNLDDLLPKLDVLYMTRVQKERFSVLVL